MTQCPGDLLGEFVVEAVDQVADMVGDVARMQLLSSLVAGVDDLHQVLCDSHHRVVVWQREWSRWLIVPIRL